jgi:hypothetical protein
VDGTSNFVAPSIAHGKNNGQPICGRTIVDPAQVILERNMENCLSRKNNESPNDKSPDDQFLPGKYLSLQEDVAYHILCLEQHNVALKHLFS